MSKMFVLFIWLAISFWLVFSHTNMPYKTPEGIAYEMPVECEGDLTEATKNTLIFNQLASNLEKWNNYLKIAPEGYQLYGITIDLPGLDPFIVMNGNLDKEQYDQTLHHERCHIISGAWHG